MAHNRLERIGTIYTRVTGLIRSGAMSLNERPLWYEIYQAFPPATPPRYSNPAPEGAIRKIFYPEDVVRAKFYKKLPSSILTNLSEDEQPSPCQKFLKKCKELSVAKNVRLEDVFDEAFASFKETLTGSKADSTRSGTMSSKVREKTSKTSVDMNQVFGGDEIGHSESKPL